MTAAEIAVALNLHPQNVRARVFALTKQGVLEVVLPRAPANKPQSYRTVPQRHGQRIHLGPPSWYRQRTFMKAAEITVEYKDHMGTDLTVVNAARTSFGKESDWVVGASYPGAVHQPRGYLSQADANLIRFLATGFRTKDWDALLDRIVTTIVCDETWKADLTEILQHYKKSAQHWAPFGHPHLQIRMKLPMFLARQFVKHQIGGVWSEESRRYMSSEPEFWLPKEWHGRPDDIKQGSDGLVAAQRYCHGATQRVVEHALTAYQQMLGEGVAPEEARIVLPLNTMTTVTWTGSLLFWSRVCNQRLDSHAQKAANELAEQIEAIARPRFPVSWAALVGG